jgi:hypothetical protein
MMSHTEKNYAFVVTKSALEATTIPYDQKLLQIFADITHTRPLVVKFLQAKCLTIGVNTEISKVGNFTALSYPRKNGDTTISTTLPEGTPSPPTMHNVTAAQCQVALQPSFH